ncbi:hypothetical protein ABW21_db0204944 [Orbilia brochopaga]|nr:hypothetical protein ABW21_db0204944 [Drechslerella brochopaga]
MKPLLTVPAIWAAFSIGTVHARQAVFSVTAPALPLEMCTIHEYEIYEEKRDAGHIHINFPSAIVAPSAEDNSNPQTRISFTGLDIDGSYPLPSPTPPPDPALFDGIATTTTTFTTSSTTTAVSTSTTTLPSEYTITSTSSVFEVTISTVTTTLPSEYATVLPAVLATKVPAAIVKRQIWGHPGFSHVPIPGSWRSSVTAILDPTKPTVSPTPQPTVSPTSSTVDEGSNEDYEQESEQEPDYNSDIDLEEEEELESASASASAPPYTSTLPKLTTSSTMRQNATPISTVTLQNAKPRTTTTSVNLLKLVKIHVNPTAATTKYPVKPHEPTFAAFDRGIVYIAGTPHRVLAADHAFYTVTAEDGVTWHPVEKIDWDAEYAKEDEHQAVLVEAGGGAALVGGDTTSDAIANELRLVNTIYWVLMCVVILLFAGLLLLMYPYDRAMEAKFLRAKAVMEALTYQPKNAEEREELAQFIGENMLGGGGMAVA